MQEYPEHEKLKAISAESQCQGQFLDWLSEQGVSLCVWDEEIPCEWKYRPIGERTEALLARYHEIDLKKLEEEKRAMLDSLRHD